MRVNSLKRYLIFLLVVSLLSGINGAALAGDMDTAMQECLIEAMQKVDDDTTVGQLKAACEEELAGAELIAEPEPGVGEVEKTALKQRLDKEEEGGNSSLFYFFNVYNTMN